MGNGLMEHIGTIVTVCSFFFGVLLVMLGQAKQAGRIEHGREADKKELLAKIDNEENTRKLSENSLDKTLSEHAARIEKMDTCIANVKKRSTDFLTVDDHAVDSKQCRSEIFRRIDRDRSDVRDLKIEVKALNKSIVSLDRTVASVETLVKQLVVTK